MPCPCSELSPIISFPEYRRKAHRQQRDLLSELNRQIDHHEGSSALKEACRQVLKDPPGFDADLTALDITYHTQGASGSCHALLNLMNAIVRHPPRHRSSSMNLVRRDLSLLCTHSVIHTSVLLAVLSFLLTASPANSGGRPFPRQSRTPRCVGRRWRKSWWQP